MRIAFVLLLLLPSLPVHADNRSDAKAHYEQGNALYALGQYSESADEYEKAFALKPDAALLYNAAQAHRLAGHKKRALLLYQNYLRVFRSSVSNQDEVQRHIENLKRAIETEEQSATSPPTTPQPMTPPPAATAPAPTTPPPPTSTAEPPTSTAPSAPTAEPEAHPTLVTTAPEKKPITKKPWFWGVMGGVAGVVVIGVVVGAVLGASPKDPTASLGAVAGN
jgi:iron complex outermembrane receptor protein